MDDWLADRRVESPAATAVVDPETDASWTYAELDGAVETLAGRLSTFDVSGERIALCAEPSPTAIQLVHAAMRAGAVIVPVDPTHPIDDGRLERVDPALVVVAGIAPDRIDQTNTPWPVRSLKADGPVASIDTEPIGSLSHARLQPDDPLVYLFTSGTTGQPDLVELTVNNVCYSAMASSKRLQTTAGDRWCSPLGLHHMGGLAPIYRAVLDGMTVVPSTTDPETLLTTLHTYEATAVSLVPVLLEQLLEKRSLPSSLRTVLLGGGPASPTLLEECLDRSVPVFPTYGMTETASQIATGTPADVKAAPDSVGRPVFTTSVTIVDENGAPCPPNTEGEIVVSGPTVSPGYVDSAAFEQCDGGFKTGDRGMLDADGRLFVSGRTDDRINTGGETVDPTAVQRAIKRHPDVKGAAVVGIEDDRWGERVGALIDRDGDCTADDLDAFLSDRLASHERPRTIVFGSIKRTPSGTVDRQAIKARLKQPGN
ncbi:class I adenylate-forming enzyme family protein [Halocatena halophila]|uniref:class I adenylate-forming enzyme family protein n=1 Tax=Halocatena halophila TaxID=2814576 RepID=UPI002ED4F430